MALNRRLAAEALDAHVDRYYHGDQDDLLDELEGCVVPDTAAETKLETISVLLDDFEQNVDPAAVIIANIRRVIADA